MPCRISTQPVLHERYTSLLRCMRDCSVEHSFPVFLYMFAAWQRSLNRMLSPIVTRLLASCGSPFASPADNPNPPHERHILLLGSREFLQPPFDLCVRCDTPSRRNSRNICTCSEALLCDHKSGNGACFPKPTEKTSHAALYDLDLYNDLISLIETCECFEAIFIVDDHLSAFNSIIGHTFSGSALRD